MIFPYENLDIAQLARTLINKTYQIIRGFPKEELFALSSQLRRASVSVLLNIAEGSGRHSKREYAQFIRNSLGSLIEVDAALKIGIDQQYLNKEKYNQEFSPIIEKLYFKLIGFEKSLIGKRFERVKR